MKNLSLLAKTSALVDFAVIVLTYQLFSIQLLMGEFVRKVS
jgi:hypothetical protein